MPLKAAGKRLIADLTKEYGGRKKAERVFWAMVKHGKLRKSAKKLHG